MTKRKRITSPSEMQMEVPLADELALQVKRHIDEIKAIYTGTSDRKILIVGPCSAWPDTAVIEYFTRLKPIAEEVSDKIKMIARVYTQKPRTALGWTGSMIQPDPGKAPDLDTGIRYCRKMMISVLEQGFAIADEALFTHNEGYYHDLLSWVAVGARSSEDPEHRVHASMLTIPVGMKNPTSGNLQVAVNSVLAAQYHHIFLHKGYQVETPGNPYAHLVLRGGNGNPNYCLESLKQAAGLLHTIRAGDFALSNPSIIVDCSHDNTLVNGRKNPGQQPKVMMSVVDSMQKDALVGKTVKGFAMESFLKNGKQSFCHEVDRDGLSITDECLGFEETIDAIRGLYQLL